MSRLRKRVRSRHQRGIHVRRIRLQNRKQHRARAQRLPDFRRRESQPNNQHETAKREPLHRGQQAQAQMGSIPRIHAQRRHRTGLLLGRGDPSESLREA